MLVRVQQYSPFNRIFSENGYHVSITSSFYFEFGLNEILTKITFVGSNPTLAHHYWLIGAVVDAKDCGSLLIEYLFIYQIWQK